MEPTARVVEATAAKFIRAGEASAAAPELVEAARYTQNIVSDWSHQFEQHRDAIDVVRVSLSWCVVA